jgi:cytochrome c-type biogenesis protein CcmH
MRVDGVWRRLLACAPGLALAWVLCALLATALPAHGNEAAPATADPALEAHVMRLSAELRCLVCQNETIAASHADLAVDLRNQVREMLRNGQTDRQVFDYMTARYGDFVLYRPPLKATTVLLWFGPFLFLTGGLLGLWWLLRQRNRLPADHFEPDENDDVPAEPPRS